MKSLAMQAALGPYAIIDDLRKKWEKEIKSAEIDDALFNLNAKDAKKKAEKAFQNATVTLRVKFLKAWPVLMKISGRALALW
ncbi:hypothetical protein GGQ85_003360 [Nitrobacter vulgaris]|nr:hypothetical protein [Nitrobacter vulgaris]